MHRLFSAAVAALVLAGSAAQAAIIQGQFTASIDSGQIRTFNPDGSLASEAAIPVGTSFNGTFRIDTALLPPGTTTSFGDASFLDTRTTHHQDGGAQWLTAQGTLGLATPLTIDFRRDPLVAKPAGAVQLSEPDFSQELRYRRTDGTVFGRCCDAFALELGNIDFWTLDFLEAVGYIRNLTLAFADATPVMLGGTGVPESATFVNTDFDPDAFGDDTQGLGHFTTGDTRFDVEGNFFRDIISADYTILTASFVTVTEVPAPGAPLLLIGAFLATALRRASG